MLHSCHTASHMTTYIHGSALDRGFELLVSGKLLSTE